MERIVKMLNESSFVKKAEAVKAIERLGHPQGLPVLRALLSGDLYARIENRRLFLGKEKGGQFELSDALSGEVTVTPTKDGLKKIIINNQMRLARQVLDDRRASRGVVVRARRAFRRGHGVSATRDLGLLRARQGAE